MWCFARFGTILYNLKNMKNTHREISLLVKLLFNKINEVFIVVSWRAPTRSCFNTMLLLIDSSLTWCSTAMNTTVIPSLCQSFWCNRACLSITISWVSSSFIFAAAICLPSTTPVNPLPCSFLNLLTFGNPSWAPVSSILFVKHLEKWLTMDAATGWLDLISNATAVFNTSFLSEIKRKKQVKCFCQKKA